MKPLRPFSALQRSSAKLGQRQRNTMGHPVATITGVHPLATAAPWMPPDLGWAYTRNQPAGYGESYPAMRMPDGTLACEHSNYRPFRGGWCRRIW
jgi:hypothetical protein